MRYVVVLALLVAVGCRHYEVTDSATNNAYYTHRVKTADDGTVRFKDAKTGRKMELASASVQMISRREYRQATKAAEEMPAVHWRITDLTALKVYYTNKRPTTTEWTTEFEDAVTGENIRLTSWDMQQISGEQFKRSVESNKDAARIKRTISWD